MFQFIADVDATLQAHSFRVFLAGVAGLVLIRVLAWVLDRPLRARTGSGYVSDRQLAALGLGAMAAGLWVRLWLPGELGQGLLVVVAVAAVVGVILHRTAHPPITVALGVVFQSAFAGATYMVALPFLASAVGAWVAYSWITSPSSPQEPGEEEEQWKRRSDLRQEEEDQAGRWVAAEEARQYARNVEPPVGAWPF